MAASAPAPPEQGGGGSLQYLHDPLNVSMAFSKVNMPEFSRPLPVLDVGFEHGARTFPLSPDHTSHGQLQETGGVHGRTQTCMISLQTAGH